MSDSSGAGGTSPAVSVIVVSYNTSSLTLECLRSVVAETSEPYELIVVDNASPDGSADAIAAEFPSLRLFAETDNHGFARANNIAAKHAAGEYLLLLNPDTVVLDGAIDELLRFARRTPAARIWGGRTLFVDGSVNPTNAWRRMSSWSLLCRVLGLDRLMSRSGVFNAEGYGDWSRDTERDVDIVSGCFLLIERSLWTELDGFDPAFVMYGEEADLCLRAQKVGARPRITPDAAIIHHGGASETVRGNKHARLIQAKITLAHRHLRPSQRPLGVALLRLWPWSRMVSAKVLATVTRRRSLRHTAEEWAEVWSRRTEWWDGYPAAVDTPEISTST